MKWSEWVVKRPVAVTMAVLVVILLGVISFTRLQIDLLPELKLPMAVVLTNYRGAGPEEVEKVVTKPLEDALGTVRNLKSIRSLSASGSSMVMLEFEWGTDMDFATLEMREKVDLARTFFPEGVEKPMVVKMDPTMIPVVTLAMYGGLDEQSLKEVAQTTLKDRLERLAGVASVSVTGGANREIQVIIPPEKLKLYNLSLLQIVQALQGENLTFSGGKVEDAGRNVLVRVTGEFKNLDQVREVALATGTGGTVKLGDLALIRDFHTERASYSLFNGKPAVSIIVQKQSGGNTVEISRAIKEEIAKLKPELPPEVVIEPVIDQADFIEKSIANLYRDMLLGGALAILIIFIFLRNLRSTLVIALTIPISLITALALFYFGHMNLNLMTLGGLSLGIGRIVDDAIVVLDNIYRHRQQGKSAEEAAIFGTGEVTNAIIAATLTTVGVFLPLAFVRGMTAEIFGPMALAVCFALLASLGVALSVTPMISARVFAGELPREITSPQGAWQRFLSGEWLGRLDARYRRFLEWALEHRRRTILIVALIFLGSLALIPVVGVEFFPVTDQGRVNVTVNLPKGTVLGETGKVADKVLQVLERQPEVEEIYLEVGNTSMSGMYEASIGGETPEAASISVTLVPRGERKKSAAEVAAAVREEVKEIPGAEIEVAAVTLAMEHFVSAPIEVALHGEDFRVLEELAQEVKAEVEKVPGAVTVKSSLEEGRPQVEIKVDRAKAARYQLGTAQIGNTVAAAMQGKVATRYRVGGEEYDLRVLLTEESRKKISDLESLTIASPLGMQVPLKEVASFSFGATPASIDRRDQVRTVSVTADLSGRPLGDVMNEIQGRLANLELPPGYTLDYAGQTEQMQEVFGELGLVLVLAIILVYMIMAAQFESLLYPFVIMFSVPVSLVGVILGLLLTGCTFNVTAFLGLIMLVGIVLSNGIILVDYANLLRRRGLPRREAILSAGSTRLRPILMTAFTTILALVPLALGIGEGAEIQAPLATAVIGGLLASTILTLILVPVLYTVFEDLGPRLTAWSRRRKSDARVTNT